MLDVRASRRAFVTEAHKNASDRRRRRRSEQLASSRAAGVPRCASTPIRGGGAATPTLTRGSMPSLAIGSVRKKLGPARFVLSDAASLAAGGNGNGAGAEYSKSGDQWLAASVAHVRELARKTVNGTISTNARQLASRDRDTGSRQGRLRRRQDLQEADQLLPAGELHVMGPEEEAKQRRRRWTQELQNRVGEQRKVLSKLKVDRSLQEDKLSCLLEKLALASAAEANTADLVPAADKKLIVLRARFDDTVLETKQMTKYADTLVLMHERAKDALHGAKVRAERLQGASDTLCNEVAQTKSLLLTLEAARAEMAKQKAKTSKQLADSSVANGEKTLALQDRVAAIDPDGVDEVELQVQAVRENKRKQRQARKQMKAKEAKAKEDEVAVALALTAARRTEIEGAITRIHAATGMNEPSTLLAKFLASRDSTSEAKQKAATAESRLQSLREELQLVLEEESKAFLAYNPDKERLASRTKALRPRTSALKLAEANLSRSRGRAKALRDNLLVCASQVFALLQKACLSVECVQPLPHESYCESKGPVHLEALELLLLHLLTEMDEAGAPQKGNERERTSRDDDSDDFSNGSSDHFEIQKEKKY
eukprot:COSAG02_NODE_8329_length_2613_cov_1.451870_1_plen_598_part_10